MYYLGLRSTTSCLQSLGSVRRMSQPHHLLSVIGGFAFLHGLPPSPPAVHFVLRGLRC